MVQRYQVDGRDLFVRWPTGENRTTGEVQLAQAGAVVPADHRLEWAGAWGTAGRKVEVWSASEGGRCLCTVVLQVDRSRALPGYQRWRVDRFGGFGDEAALEAVLHGVTDGARGDPTVVDVSLCFAGHGAFRDRMATSATRLGYSQLPRGRHYDLTSSVDLRGTEEEVLSRMHSSCRRGIRSPAKHGLVVEALDDPGVATRLRELYAETMGRTRSSVVTRPWRSVIEYSARNPDAARLVGTYSTDRVLLAFALGLRQGDHVEYRTAASTRVESSAPLGYVLAWDLMTWARAGGAEWFDFGGLPLDPVPAELAGIVRFKESFGGMAIRFREEWALELRPRLSAWRRRLSRGVVFLQSIGRRLPTG